jgi:hypothetical protein
MNITDQRGRQLRLGLATELRERHTRYEAIGADRTQT